MDLRNHLASLEAAGQLKTIDEEIDWNLQAGALASMSNNTGGPALHFTKVKGYPSGYSLAGSLYTGPSNIMARREGPWTRQAIALGLDPAAYYEDFVATLLQRTTTPVPPTLVTTGPCKENILTGQDVDVLKFPVPYLHEGDGGRYGTCSYIAVKDPDSSWQHWGYYRWMVLGKDRLTGYFHPMRPLSAIYSKYEARNEPMPFCIVMGGDALNFIAANLLLMPGVDEAAIAGGMRTDPIALVKAETNDLLVPIDAEIVLEGVVPPGERADEGPFPEYIKRAPKSPQPVFHLTAITHRNNPIFPFIAEGSAKVSDSLNLMSTAVSLALTQLMKFVGLFDIRWINVPVDVLMSVCLVSLKTGSTGEAGHIARLLFNHPHPLTHWFDKLVVLDDDIEPVNWIQLMQDFIQKVNPEIDYHWLEGSPTFMAEYSNSEEKNKIPAKKLYIDATWPYWWEKGWTGKRLRWEYSFTEEVKQRVVSRWKEMGLPGEPVVHRSTWK